MSKKNIIVLVVIIVIVIVGLFLWRGGFFGPKVGPTGEVTGPGIMGDIGDKVTGGIMGGSKMTDDIYVEMMVKVVALQAEKNPATYAASLESLYKKYNITEASMEAYAKELENNPERAMAIAQKYAQEVAKLQGVVQ